MSASPVNDIRYIHDAVELESLFSDDQVVKQCIEFVSVLTSIDFNPQTRCLFQFKNFKNGDGGDPDYTCKISCNSAETLNLTKLTLSLFAQQFDLELTDLDNPEGFCINEMHLDKLCFVCCKGTFVSCNNKGGIFVQGLRVIDLHSTLFDDGKSKQKDNIMGTLQATFDNLMKLNDNSKAQFKFVKLQNYDLEMRRYVQCRQEALLKLKEKNPLFGLSRIHADHDSQNDFDSQIPDTDSNIGFTLHDSEKHSAEILISTTDSLAFDRIEDSENSRLTTCTTSYGSSAVIRATPTSQNTDDTLASDSTMGTFPGGRANVPQKRGFSSHEKAQLLELISSDEDDDKLSSGDEAISELRLRAQSGSDDSHFNYMNSSSPNIKRARSAFSEKPPPSDVGFCIPNISSGECVILRGLVLGLRINDASYTPSVVLFFRPESLLDKNDRGPLFIHDNCIEILVHITDNVKVNSEVIRAESSLELLDIMRYNVEDKAVTIEVRKTPYLLTDQYFTFSWTLRDVRTEQGLPQKLAVISDAGSQSSQVITSSQESSQRMPDPLKTFSELSLAGNQVEFIRAYALLVAVKPFTSKMYKFVMTDFTSHPLNKLSAFDSFLGSYVHRLRQEMAFPFVIYNDHYFEFKNKLKRAIGREMSELFSGNDRNISSHGIVCRISLKAKLYGNSIDGIIRKCEPILVGQQLSSEEKEFVQKFYIRAISEIPQILLSSCFPSFKKFFPITMFRDLVVLTSDEDSSHNSTLSTPPFVGSLQKIPSRAPPKLDVELAHFELVRDIDIPVLHKTRGVDGRQIYHITGKVVAAVQTQQLLTFYITNDYVSQDMLDPERVLRVEIPGAQNVEYFFGANAGRQPYHGISARDPQLQPMLGEIFTFRLVAFSIPVSPQRNLRIWCPIECTIQEMKCELAARTAQSSSVVKREDA